MNGETINNNEIWDELAPWWDNETKEGDPFHRELIIPQILSMIDSTSYYNVLDFGCGNGAFSRRLAKIGHSVTALDFSEAFIEIARVKTRSEGLSDNVNYHVCDISKEHSTSFLLDSMYEYIVCSMVLQDLEDISAVSKLAARTLVDKGKFIFSIPHPCFNGRISIVSETMLLDGYWKRQDAIKVFGYKTPDRVREESKPGQPILHNVYYRSITDILSPFFEFSFALSNLVEPCFKMNKDDVWCEIPPVLIGELVKV